MKSAIMSATLYLLMTGALAAPAPPVPAVYTSENDGYIYAPVDRGNKLPEFKFCPIGHRADEISDVKDQKVGCGPDGKGSKWDGSFKKEQVVPSINGQEFLDQTFGKGTVRFTGTAPIGYKGVHAVIFYKIIKK